MTKPKHTERKARQSVASPSAATTDEMDIDTFLAGGFETVAALNGTLPSVEPVEPASKRIKKTATHRKKVHDKGPSQSGQIADQAGHPARDVGIPVHHELKSHKSQLEALKTTDPAFYQYLVESDKALLTFSDGDDDQSGSDGPGTPHNELVGDALTATEVPTENDEHSITPIGYASTAEVERACAGAKEDASLGAVRRVLSLYRTACHHGDPANNDAEDVARLRIASDAAFQRILVFTLSEADIFFRRLLCLGTAQGTAIPSATFKSSKWRKVGPLVKSYLGNTLHLLAHLAEENSSMFILRRLRASAAFLAAFDILHKKTLKLVAGMFGSSESHRVRLQALLWLRETGLTCGPDALSAVLRVAYRTFAAHANFVTATSLPHIAFMVSGLVELYGIDLGISYEVMFGFVAQLAGLLRDALTMKTVDSYRDVYSWRAINCLELWGRVVAAHADRGSLGHLVYPVVQLLLAAARLVPSPRWFPVRLRLARILNAVAAATGVFVPVAPLLLELLAWPGFTQKVSGSGKCPDLLRQLRLSKANLKLASVQQELVEQAMELLSGSLALSARSPGFPELAHLPTVALRRFVKTTPAERFRSQATLLLHAIDENAKYIGLKRDAVDFAPKDTAAASTFLQNETDVRIPLLAYAQRLAEKGAQKRLLAQADTTEPLVEEEVSDMDIDLDDGAQLRARAQSDTATATQPTATNHLVDDHVSPLKNVIASQDDLLQDYVVSDDESDEQLVTEPTLDDVDANTNGRKIPHARKHPNVLRMGKGRAIPVQSTGASKQGKGTTTPIKKKLGARNKHGR